jgi:hypothetical protein
LKFNCRICSARNYIWDTRGLKDEGDVNAIAASLLAGKDRKILLAMENDFIFQIMYLKLLYRISSHELFLTNSHSDT